MRYDVLEQFFSQDSGEILRANSYVVVDQEKVESNTDYRNKLFFYHDRIRKCGFKLIKKNVQKFVNEAGETSYKANADMDLGIDALLQATKLDKIVIVSGDGDFVRLVTAIQNMGCRVEVIGFDNVSRQLKESADLYCSGFLIPGLLPTSSPERVRGYLASYNEEGAYGFFRTFLLDGGGFVRKDAFFHVTSCNGCEFNSNDVYKPRQRIYEFQYRPSQKKEGTLEAFDINLAFENILV